MSLRVLAQEPPQPCLNVPSRLCVPWEKELHLTIFLEAKAPGKPGWKEVKLMKNLTEAASVVP